MFHLPEMAWDLLERISTMKTTMEVNKLPRITCNILTIAC
jgi:hypothetical protein